VVLKENRIMMVSDEMGDIPAGNSKGLGLYFSDTRFVSTYEFRLNRLQPILLSASVDEKLCGHLPDGQPRPAARRGQAAGFRQQSLSIRRSRFIYGGLHERIGIQNCGTETRRDRMLPEDRGDFSRHVDVRGYKVASLVRRIRPSCRRR